MKTQIMQDIHSYTIFANIDNRNGKIAGHQIIITKEQREAIEDIIISRDIRVIEEESYELEK